MEPLTILKKGDKVSLQACRTLESGKETANMMENLSFLEREFWPVDRDRLVEIAVIQMVVSQNRVPVVPCPQKCGLPGFSDPSKPNQ